MKTASEIRFGNLPSYKYGVESYDSTKLGLGPRITQRVLGGANEDSFAGPLPIAVARPMEQSTAIPAVFPWAMQWSNTQDWVFLADNATAAATRRVVMYQYQRDTQIFAWQGFININFPTATVHTIRALRMTYDKHIVGTASASGTTVTGVGTNWKSDNACVGNRIGFGSTNPSEIVEWYEIGAIASNTSITLTTAANTYPAGTPYVIEDLRAIVLTTNATAANGGLFVVKGLRRELFYTSGTNIAAATTIDNIRACYWLADAATVTNAIGLGLAMQPIDDLQNHICWSMDTTTNPVLFKYNLRAALTIVAGKSTSAFLFKTGNGGILTGAASQLNNSRFANAKHGPGNGLNCIYFTTASRLYRTMDVGGITVGSTTWLIDNAIEIPPGGINTISASGLLQSVEYASGMDKFIVAVGATTTPFRSYVTQYITSGGQWDRVFGTDTRTIDQVNADSSITPTPNMVGGPYTVWSEGGILYIATYGTTAVLNRLYALPLSADWEYVLVGTDRDRLISPKISTTNAEKYTRIYTQSVQVLGGATGKNLGMPTEPFRTYFRVTGIDDDTGTWNLLDSSGTLSAAGQPYIQLMYEFRTIGATCIPARLLGSSIIYEDTTTDSHFQFSQGKSSGINKQFAWRISSAFGGAIPVLKITLYDAVTNGLLVTDTTVGATGLWEKTTDGVTWTAYNTTDRANETTYIRYTPSSLADNINVKPILTLN